jgi:hypothetical protein
MTRRDDLLVEIAREESRPAALNTEVEDSSARLAALQNEFAAEPSVQVVITPVPASVMVAAPMTNAAKVALFRSLFRGREDVFPRRWENAKKHKSGYSPACDNEWEHHLCEEASLCCCEQTARPPGPPRHLLARGRPQSPFSENRFSQLHRRLTAPNPHR